MLVFLAAILPMLGREKHTAVARTGYKRMALLGVIDVSAFFAYFMGFREGLVSIVAPIANSSSIITIILAHIFIHERVPFHQRIGIITIVLRIASLSAIS